ncbi:hypothetical protein ACAG25_15250 [Mycobacterium sp. pV006]|uniref:hypothetical protein n=1 Tax=Mycobacterium sp. pV006 TaxID=3238983 RepID=UPI00351B4A5D
MTPAAHGDIGAPRSRGPSRGTPYRLVVLGTDAAEVVSVAAGVIYDSTSTGWQVDVHLEHDGHPRALSILGTRSRPLPEVLELETDCPDVVLLGASLIERHQPIHRLATSLTRHRRSDVAVWGTAALPPQLDMSMCFDYRLSTAAMAFKRQALAAAGLADGTTDIETFRRGRRSMTAVPPFESSA